MAEKLQGYLWTHHHHQTFTSHISSSMAPASGRQAGTWTPGPCPVGHPPAV